MHNDQIINATPDILREMIKSRELVFSAEAYFIALSDMYRRDEGESPYRKRVKADLLREKFAERVEWAAKKAFEDFWQTEFGQVPEPLEDDGQQAPVVSEKVAVLGRLKSITRSAGGFNVHVSDDVSDHVFYVSKANCLVDKLLFLLNKDVVVEYDSSVNGPDGLVQAYTITLFRPPG
jgi:hypothetical protein